jgi:hypothetical protein
VPENPDSSDQRSRTAAGRPIGARAAAPRIRRDAMC